MVQLMVDEIHKFLPYVQVDELIGDHLETCVGFTNMIKVLKRNVEYAASTQ